MNNPDIIFTECYPDTKLIESLNLTDVNISHQEGKGGIQKYILDKKINKALIVADQDPKKRNPSFFSNFQTLKSFENDAIIVKRYKNILLVELCPELEQWIIDTTSRNNMNLNEFGLSADPKKLHSIISHRIPPDSYINFINKMIKTRIAPFLLIKSIIENRNNLENFLKTND